jgi:hypothetical protein
MEKKSKGRYPEVRELTRKDRKKLSDLIRLFAERSGNMKLTEMLPGQTGEKKDKNKKVDTDQTYELIKSVMQSLLDWVEDEVNVWFMELIGVTDREVYDSLPFDIEVHIIDSLISQKGFNNFFSRASALYKKIRG